MRRIYKKKWLGIAITGGRMKTGYVIRSKDFWRRYYRYKGVDEFGYHSYQPVKRIEDATIFNSYRDILEKLKLHKSEYMDKCVLTDDMFFAYGIDIIRVEHEVDACDDTKQKHEKETL